jgi:hypothetical protein
LITGTELLVCCGFSSFMFIWVEMEKLVAKKLRTP